ncbi:MAG: D-cysteine desulfhydrase family protein [Acidobacteria bacterium]|nr:D-cysteine desulfhydrase family protein [Acidobacteriota bacterium]
MHSFINSRLEFFPRLNAGHYPTPIEELPRLRAALGKRAPRLFIKRDDYTGAGLGGNKVRKLEYVLAQAQADGADVVISMGGEKSNHARVTAALCARLGLPCELVMNPPNVRYDGLKPANLVADELFGAKIHRVANRDERNTFSAELAARYMREGRRVALVPLGASIPLGALGFVRAIGETKAQLDAANIQITHIVHASSSGGTQAGIVAGCQLYGLSAQVVGMSPDDPSASIAAHVADIITDIGALLETTFDNRVIVRDEFVGAGYGIPTDESTNALALVARTEGILLDPVYTAKAMAGLIAMIGDGELTADDTVLFWHTGGQLALFYAPQ